MRARFQSDLAFLGALACTCILLTDCTSAGNNKTATTAGKAAAVHYIPGGGSHTVSPLAHLMREMTAFADSTGKRLSKDEGLLPFPGNFKDIMTAGSTPGMVDHRTFDPFAFDWLHQLDSLYNTPAVHRSEVFNGLVQRCTNCHGEVCPGPLDRIRKLRIPGPGMSPAIPAH
jgi:hypothetical protein